MYSPSHQASSANFPTNDASPCPVVGELPPLPVPRPTHGVAEVHDPLQLVEGVGEDPAEAGRVGAAVLDHHAVGAVREGGGPDCIC